MCTVYMQCLKKQEEGMGFPETGVMRSCELPCVHCELNPGPKQEQQVLLATKPTIQLPK